MRFLDSISLFSSFLFVRHAEPLSVCQQGSRVHQQLTTILMLSEALVFISRVVGATEKLRFDRDGIDLCICEHLCDLMRVPPRVNLWTFRSPNNWRRSASRSHDGDRKFIQLISSNVYWTVEATDPADTTNTFLIARVFGFISDFPCLFTHCTFESVWRRPAGRIEFLWEL